jgi:UDP-4-keto-D-FucNAc 4-reductase
MVNGSSRKGRSAFSDKEYLKVDWSKPSLATGSVFENVDAVIHCAGLAHETGYKSRYQDYFDANVTAAINVFVEAELSGVRKFIFLSSLSVFDTSGISVIIDDKTEPCPINDYGKTKYIAEQELIKLATKSDVELVIVRTPLVVGASAPGNLKSLLKLLNFPLPLPLVAKTRHRSFITIGSLAEYCGLILNLPHNPGVTEINLANTPAIKLSELVEFIRRGLGVRNLNIYFPEKALFLVMYFLGRRLLFNKIYGGLFVVPSAKATEVGWEPAVDWKDELYELGIESKNARKRELK